MQQKTIGLLGGIGWASTLEYYRTLNEMVTARLGDDHSARIALISMDPWDFSSRASQTSSMAIEQLLVDQSQRLKAAGADFYLWCANGAHRFAPAVTPQVDMPFISIVEVTARQVHQRGLQTVGLLGVRQTMSGLFYQNALQQYGIETLTPDGDEQTVLHDIIFQELIHNRITSDSRAKFLRCIDRLEKRGAQGVILGCTEIGLLISPQDVTMPTFNTLNLHCAAAVDLALAPWRKPL
jgi:aspartate racemase